MNNLSSAFFVNYRLEKFLELNELKMKVGLAEFNLEIIFYFQSNQVSGYLLILAVCKVKCHNLNVIKF